MVRIYGLICPKEQKILYIGKTSLTLNRRLGQHLNKAYLNKTKKDKWLLSLICLKLTPEIVLLEESPDNLVNNKEREWILNFGLENLTNGNIGGGGGNAEGIYRNQAYKDKFLTFLESSKYSKNTVKNSIYYVNKFINYFKDSVKSPKEINSTEIIEYLKLIPNRNTRNSNIIALKLFYKVVLTTPIAKANGILSTRLD